MDTQEIIRDFFEEQFQDTSRFFLYKDKQLLKEERYRAFAGEQLRKAGKIFWSVSFGLFLCSWYGIVSLIEYGSNPNWFDLAIGITAWVGLIGSLLAAAKEYYTIKSSMTLLIKLMESTEE